MADKPKKMGVVTHYYSKLGVAIVKLAGPVKIGDALHFEGHTTNFDQNVAAMQFDHKDIEVGEKGKEVGIKVDEKVRDGDTVSMVE